MEEAVLEYGMRRMSVLAIVLSPIAIFLTYSVLLLLHSTRDFALSMRGENRTIELLTFASLFLGGVLGLMLAWKAKQSNEACITYGFYLVFSIGLIATAMEEIAWGQWFFGFETPLAWKGINVQGELTLHNIRGIHGKTEFLRFAYGVGGLVGIWLARFPKLRLIGTPKILLFWFLIISIHATLDLHVQFFTIEYRIDNLINLVSEFTELMIGISGFLYIWINTRRIGPNRNAVAL